ncbi:hypothetical protein HMPREF0973_03104, partial [Prevotella veroralis F0319]
ILLYITSKLPYADRRGRLSLLYYSVFLTLLLCLPFLLCCPSLARTAGTKTRKRPSQCEKAFPCIKEGVSL